ncbi:uncharacterized protein LOC105184115 [Harpegnathos saltator]|uniref:uncharacterized protein LOC105184115 n=1 Tax=Harpegnathos saltator TaxID=610380 RepID=UPI000DBEED4E|nr:uncharacterized protein LOC105184115 [Harpegnathos saltator]
MRQALKPMYIRAVRGYSTLSYMAATTLGGFPPVELLAEERRILYWIIKELREEGELTARDLRALQTQAVARTQEMWRDALQLAPRVRKAGLAVASLMRAQRHLGWRDRRLYIGAVLSIALYGAPIWAPQLQANSAARCLLRQALRSLMIRAIREFRTVSYMAATTLAVSPPVELLAEERRILYSRVKELRETGKLSARSLEALKTQARARILERWEGVLADSRGSGLATAEAVRTCLAEVSGRRGREMSFHLVQVLTGHGCFGKYLHRIRKEPTTRCGSVPDAHKIKRTQQVE